MLMDLLFEGEFDAYFKEASLGDRTCVFVHVPKTAGTSLRGEMAQILQPDINIEVDYTDESRSFHDRMDEAVDRFLAAAEAGAVRFASGHIMGRHVSRIRARLPNAHFVSFLRDPVERVVSDYRYQRSPRHPLHADFIARVPSLDAYLELLPEQNKHTKHMVPREIWMGGDPAECVDYIMRTYAFVGVQEMYPISFRTLSTLIGAPAWPKLRENVNTDTETDRRIPQDLALRVREANALDCAIYNAFFPRWRKIRNTLSIHLSDYLG